MARIEDWNSPIVIMILLVATAVTTLASLLLVVLVCACGKKRNQEAPPEADEKQPQETGPPPGQVEQALVQEQVDETKSAKTAIDAQSCITEKSSMLTEKAADFQLMSQKGQYGAPVSTNMTSDSRFPSLKLLESSNSYTVETSDAKSKSVNVSNVRSAPRAHQPNAAVA